MTIVRYVILLPWPNAENRQRTEVNKLAVSAFETAEKRAHTLRAQFYSDSFANASLIE